MNGQDSSDVPATKAQAQPSGPNVKTWLPELVVDGALPYLTYLVLRSQGVGSVVALAAGAVFPATFIVVRFLRQRRLDGFGVVVLAVIAVGAGVSLLSGDARFALVKESLLTGAIGLAALGSLVAPRPMMYYSGRKFATDGSPDGMARWESYWVKSAMFRRSNRMMTVVWGRPSWPRPRCGSWPPTPWRHRPPWPCRPSSPW